MSSYKTHREKMARRSREQSTGGRDVGEKLREALPVANQRRRNRCKKSLATFCRTYLPAAFPLPWSNDHKKVIAKLERAVRTGGLFAHSMPRGSGKTTLSEAAVLWAILYGFRRYVCLIGATADRARVTLESLKTELESNELLLADFRWELFAIHALERIHNRAHGQTVDGDPTRIVWTQDKIVMPWIVDVKDAEGNPRSSACPNSIITVTGLEGGNIRGQKHKLADGTVLRPSQVIIDDPQTTESAWSAAQSQRREALLAGDVLGMAGPGQKIAAVCCCTVIRPGDMADNILDRQKHPEWQGERTKLVYSFPTNMKLWEEYERIRSESLQADGDGKEATAFYRKHRKEMDEGAVVAWPERHDEDELSAIQNAMNLLFRDRAAFYAEYQSEPLPETAGTIALTAGQIASRCNGLARGEIPIKCTTLTAFIDVHAEVLYWVVIAWEPDFTGYLVDYGTFPDQRRSFFTLETATQTLSRQYPGKGPEAVLREGLLALFIKLAGFQWQRQDGASMFVMKAPIDKGYMPDVVEQAIRASGRGAVLIPSKGIGIRAGDKPMSEYRKGRGDMVGFHWRIPAASQPRELRAINIDTNFWKSFVHHRLATPVGDRGGLSFFGQPTEHRLISEHLAAEYAIKTEGRGRVVDDWKERPGKPDNHWFDCVVGATVAASTLGVALPGMEEAGRAIRKRYTAADLERLRKR